LRALDALRQHVAHLNDPVSEGTRVEPGSLVVDLAQHILVEAILCHLCARGLVFRAQPELKITLVVGRQLHSDCDVGAGVVATHNNPLAVFATLFVGPRLKIQCIRYLPCELIFFANFWLEF
jgi:hypothetical protein